VAVEPDRLEAFIQSLEAQGFVGGNVTIPHKEAALRLVEADETAQAIGAVNTIWRKNGRLFGSNTDAYGFVANLDAGSPTWQERASTALVLGAGGAARAVVHALLSRGLPEIVLANRTRSRAETLAHAFGPRVKVVSWDELCTALPAAGLLVNATSLGMQGKPTLALDIGALQHGAIVTDLVYVPLETELLRAARLRGHPTIDGLGMLLHQAVPGFERWFGRRPQVTSSLRQMVENDIGVRA
jgi:shikimate dehydrogenase